MSAEATHRTLLSDDACVCSLEGEIDLSNAERVGGEVLAAVPADVLGLALDVSGLRYLDSTGVSTLFALARSLHGRRQSMVLVVPDGSALDRLFQITKVPLAIPVERSVESALTRLHASVEEPL